MTQHVGRTNDAPVGEGEELRGVGFLGALRIPIPVYLVAVHGKESID